MFNLQSIKHNARIIFLFIGITFSYNVVAFTPNSNDVVDLTDFAYLKAKYATQLDTTVDKKLVVREYRIKQYEIEDSKMIGGPVRDILFLGSSSIQFWNSKNENLEADMAPLTSIVNRGIGATILKEQILYFPRLALPHKPKLVVMACVNDIAKLGNDEIFEQVRYCEYLVHEAFPNAIFFVVSFKPSLLEARVLQKTKDLNAILENYADIRPKTEYINCFDALMNADGTINSTFFRPDGLHFTNAGYKAIAPCFRIPLMQAMDSLNKMENKKQKKSICK